uniref:Uncharacterized protein n=1 Tax=Sphaerodactylus townsendi TaxID=933632 RepID=A0ACB8EDA2_9SAUR
MAEYVFSYINNFTSDMFQELLKHLLQCANDAREIIKHDKWRQCFLQLFLDCDHGQVGLLHRQRVLALLENFYNNCSEPVRKGLRNPSQWPMIELDDIDLFEFWGQVEDGQGLSKLSSLLNKSSQLELSAQASLLNQILKGILSEEVLALPDTRDITRMSLDSEEVVLVQQAISASEIIASEEVVEGQEEMVALADTETITGVSLSSKEVVLEQRVSSASKTIASKEVVEGQEQRVSSASKTIASKEVVEGQEQRVSSASKTIASKEVVEGQEQQVSSASKTVASKEVVEGQEEPDPTTFAGSSAAVEDPFIEAMKVGLDTRESNENVRPEGSATTSEGEATVLPEEVSKGSDLGSVEQMSSDEPGTTVKMSIAEPASSLGEETTVPKKDVGAEEGHEHSDEIPKDQPDVITAESLVQATVEGQVSASGWFACLSRARATLPPPSIAPVAGLSWLPSWKSSKSISKTPQLISEQPWSGNIETANLAFRYSDYGKEVWEDWKTENSRFPGSLQQDTKAATQTGPQAGLLMNMLDIQSHGAPSSTSAFDKHFLNLPQFVQLMEMFIGTEISPLDLKKLVKFVKEGYVLLEREKISQMERVHHDAFVARQHLLLAALFEKWDNEGSGFLDMKEVDAVLSTFKEGMEQEALEKDYWTMGLRIVHLDISSPETQVTGLFLLLRAKLQLPIPLQHPSGVVKLSQKDFRTYIDLVAAEFTGNEDEVLDNIVEYLMTTVEKTHAEQLRGAARRKWLYAVQHTAKINGGSIDPVYQAAFKALARDADAHGEGKTISAHIALLEYNVLFPERGDVLLRYVACTEDDAPYLLNQSLYMDMKGISFAAALEDRPIHVPRVQLHGHIHFWNYNRPEKERKGSFLVIPLEDIRRRVFGILGLDTLRDQNEDTIIVPHEIRFYQGVAKAFSVAYHHIRTQDSIKQVIVTGMEWLSTKAPGIHAISAYFMEPGKERIQDYALRRVMTTNRKGQMEIIPHPAPALSRNENIFRDYLFQCIDCAEVVAAYVYEDHHIAVPLRDPAGYATVVLDINLGRRKKLPAYEHKDLQKMLKMAQEAICEILKEELGDLEPYHVLEAEYVGDWRRGGVLFYRFMLQDLQNCIFNLDPKTCFEEIKSYEQPPLLVHKILKCVLLILYPQWAGTEEVENWKCCLKKLDEELIENISYFDPTAAYVQVRYTKDSRMEGWLSSTGVPLQLDPHLLVINRACKETSVFSDCD